MSSPRPLKVFICHARADRGPVRTLYTRLTTLALAGSAREDGVDAWLSSHSPKGLPRTEQGISIPLCHAHADRDPVRALPAGTRLTQDGVDAWLDKEKLLPGQGFDRLNLPDWELEIRKAVRERV